MRWGSGVGGGRRFTMGSKHAGRTSRGAGNAERCRGDLKWGCLRRLLWSTFRVALASVITSHLPKGNGCFLVSDNRFVYTAATLPLMIISCLSLVFLKLDPTPLYYFCTRMLEGPGAELYIHSPPLLSFCIYTMARRKHHIYCVRKISTTFPLCFAPPPTALNDTLMTVPSCVPEAWEAVVARWKGRH